MTMRGIIAKVENSLQNQEIHIPYIRNLTKKQSNHPHSHLERSREIFIQSRYSTNAAIKKRSNINIKAKSHILYMCKICYLRL